MIDPRRPDFDNHPAAPGRPPFSYAPADASVADRPLVSILTPFFNPGEQFRETARSVFAQSLQAFEWLIVNDRSTDPVSLAILEEFRSLDPRVRVLDLPVNSGPSAARNAGFRAARTEFVYQLDADDLVEPTCVEKCYWFLLRHPEYAFCYSYEVGFGAQGYLWTHGFHTPHMFLSECPVGAHTVMIRRSVHGAIGGYDESMRAGLEDWEFFLRAADRGHWGATIPEYLSWYRRRGDHAAHWADWDGGERQRAFLARMRAAYPDLFSGAKPFPHPPPRWPAAYERVERTPPPDAGLAPRARRLLLIAPWLRMGGSDKFNLDMVGQLARRGWEITIACTIRGPQTWLPEFSAITPDIFICHNFLRAVDHPLFLRYLIESRRPEVVLVSNSELAYLALPYLRSVCPEPTYADYIHMEETYWKNGGYPRYSVGVQDQLDLTVVSSRHLRSWMAERGADAGRIDVVTTNIDPDVYRPDPSVRARVRAELAIDEETPVVLFAGRLCAQKQPHVLADTLRRLAETGDGFVALIVGDGPDGAYLAQFIRDNGLGSRVRMLGEASSARVRELLAAADIFFLPSLWEGIALVLYEAMATGTVFVGARVGGHAEIVDESCGVLIERSTPDAEAAEYASILSGLIRDPARRRALAGAARERIVASYTLDAMGEGIDASLRRAACLARREPRARLSPGLAIELADRAVEFLRINDTADWLWAEREATLKAQAAASSAPTHVEPRPVPGPHIDAANSAIYHELVRIEASRSYRLLQRTKRTLAYRALARLRFGPAWDVHDPTEDPARRLARIKGSRSYRLIESLKRTGLYDAYARRRYGPDWNQPNHA